MDDALERVAGAPVQKSWVGNTCTLRIERGTTRGAASRVAALLMAPPLLAAVALSCIVGPGGLIVVVLSLVAAAGVWALLVEALAAPAVITISRRGIVVAHVRGRRERVSRAVQIPLEPATRIRMYPALTSEAGARRLLVQRGAAHAVVHLTGLSVAQCQTILETLQRAIVRVTGSYRD